ncbi:hypothetical protein K4K52_007690 [Colletotrichum sp. SAR 10_76]|nr:hypothetical protein K4K52_007690 [Colletotrichum sp. SAR 10_76]
MGPDAQQSFCKALCRSLLLMLAVAMLVGTCQAHVQDHHHKGMDKGSNLAFQADPSNQVSSLPSPRLNRREMQTVVLTTTISTYIELGIPCDATEIPQSMSSLLTRPPPLSIPTSLGSIVTGGNSLTAPDGGSPAPPQTSTLRSTSAAENPKPSSSNSLSSSQTSSTSTTGIQSSTIDHTSTADSSSAPAFHDSTQTIIVSPSSAAASPDVHPRVPEDSNIPGPTKRIVRFSQRICYTENKHQIMVIATYEDNHVVTVYTAPERTDLPAVLVLDDQNGNKRGSLKMTFRMGFFTIDFRSEMAGRVVEWENHWTKNEADEDAPWCETVYLKDDGKERLAREIWCYYTA